MNVTRILTSGVNTCLTKNTKKILHSAKTGVLGLTLSGMPAQAVSPSIDPLWKHSEQVIKSNVAPEYLLNDSPLLFKHLLFKNVIQQDINTGKFLKSLKENKASLIKDLDITEEKYDEFCELTKIIGDDSKQINTIGDPGCPSLYDMANPFIPEHIEEYPKLAAMYKKLEYNPLDMELLTVQNPSKHEKKLFAKYGIDTTAVDISPEQKAIEAIIHIDRLDNSYPKYLELLDEIRPDTNSVKVKESIENAKNIVKDEVKLTTAIMQLELSNMFERYNIVDNTKLLENLVSKKDLNDLKIYASTLVLDKNDYIYEVWNRHAIIPAGKNKDRACANILSILFNKQ